MGTPVARTVVDLAPRVVLDHPVPSVGHDTFLRQVLLLESRMVLDRIVRDDFGLGYLDNLVEKERAAYSAPSPSVL